MKIHDISVSLSNQMPVYPGDPPLRITREHSVPEAEFNVSDIVTGTHIGTHIDPPFHFIESGYTVDQIPLDHLYGKAEVVDLTHVKATGHRGRSGGRCIGHHIIKNTKLGTVGIERFQQRLRVIR